ncbi:MAG: S46 family peptidase [Gemmatimonadales bacterium]
MRNEALCALTATALAVGAGACASGGGAQTAAVPMAPPETVMVAAEMDVIEPIEPGRFDMGKMWTFENAPVDYFEEAYGFQATPEWLTSVRLASLRIPGCTASFVSGSGLVMTNHHCARGHVSRVTEEGENLLDNGFYATTHADERPAPNMWADQMVRMEDVTALIDAGADPEAVGDSASTAHGLRCGVTSLYQGGKYSLYCYRRFTDVRLVFAPELQIGYFGGDPDNFTYPRYNIDVSFFRVYEDGEPYEPEHYFGWSLDGAGEGDAVFVIGNPGSTERLSTMAQLTFARDQREPTIVHLLKTRTDILSHFMEHHPDQRDRYINQWFGWMNALKLYMGREQALHDPEIMGRKAGFELQFRDAVNADPALQQQYGTIWDEIAELRDGMREVYPTVMALSTNGSLRSQTMATAAELIQFAQMTSAGAPDSVVQELRAELEAREINTMLDHHMISAMIDDAQVLLGDDDPFAVAALTGGRTVEEAGHAIIEASPSVVDQEARRALLDDPQAIVTGEDEAIRLMRDVMPRYQEAAQRYGQLINQEGRLTPRLARALFDVYGTDLPPDATFTLRIADGVVAGYDYNGTWAPAWTTFWGLYDRHYSHEGKEEWALPDRWLDPPADFDLSTPVNMVSTNDITGGNSGSPMINIDREIVGLIFDGNIESLSGDFIYTTEVARSVSVRAEGILEALRAIYRADRIVQEIGGN